VRGGGGGVRAGGEGGGAVAACRCSCRCAAVLLCVHAQLPCIALQLYLPRIALQLYLHCIALQSHVPHMLALQMTSLEIKTRETAQGAPPPPDFPRDSLFTRACSTHAQCHVTCSVVSRDTRPHACHVTLTQSPCSHRTRQRDGEGCSRGGGAAAAAAAVATAAAAAASCMQHAVVTSVTRVQATEEMIKLQRQVHPRMC